MAKSKTTKPHTQHHQHKKARAAKPNQGAKTAPVSEVQTQSATAMQVPSETLAGVKDSAEAALAVQEMAPPTQPSDQSMPQVELQSEADTTPAEAETTAQLVIPEQEPINPPEAQPTPETATQAAAEPPSAPESLPKKTRTKQAAKEPLPKKTSALDAAAKVLAESGHPMTTQALIEAMAVKGYWSSPGGRTPAATLYSAILRELTTKGEQARFVKSECGKFGPRR
jgi:hypothetical protein